MLSEEIQLGYALEAFGWAHSMGVGWATTHLLYFKSAGITSMSDLATGCKENTVNLDLELFGVPPEERLSEKVVQYLKSFLPGPVGFRCFRLAQKAAEKVRKGTADTEYVHRPESGKKGPEEWHIPTGEQWTINVDCAGFVRNCLKHVTKDPLVMSLSDRDFMRAKDFFGFFSTIPYSVLDAEDIPESDRRMKWRVVKDLRMVIPGDVICYRPKGNAAGGAAFTINDRKDLNRLLKAVKTAQLWREMDSTDEWGNHLSRNVAKDPKVKPWVEAVKAKLNAVGIYTVRQLHAHLDTLNDELRAADYSALYRETIDLMRECVETTAQNTGHIVFCSGPALHMGDNEYRVRVVHSTKYGKLDANGEPTTGVQEYYKRFRLVENSDGTHLWTRTMRQAKPLIDPNAPSNGAVSDEEDNPLDDMEEEENQPPPEEEETTGEPEDELSGQAQVEVIAARMCF
jgi:hypothetical protein